MSSFSKNLTEIKEKPVLLTSIKRQELVKLILTELPQTQCTRCGFKDCEEYACAIADQQVSINRCQPGGQEGILRLFNITKNYLSSLRTAPHILDPEVGIESVRSIAVIDEEWCIGCVKCIEACPVDAIIGAAKHMHTVIEEHCTGCELCIPVCPVDCIQLIPSSLTESAPTGWAAWSTDQAVNARLRYSAHQERLLQRKKNRGKKVAEKSSRSKNLSLEKNKLSYIAEIMAKAKSNQK